MKINSVLLPLILSFIALPCLGIAQKPAPFTSLPLKEVEAVINRPESKGDLPQMAADALASRRIELIELFFDGSHSSGYLYRAVRDVADEPFKAQVVLMMLRSKSGFWPPDFYTTGFFARRPLDEPIKGILKTYLPNENFDDSVVATAEARLAVAEKLSSALEKAASTKRVSEQASVPVNNMTQPPPMPSVQAPVPPPTPLAAIPKHAAPPLVVEPEQNGHFNLALWIATGLIILTTLVLLRRKQQRKRL